MSKLKRGIQVPRLPLLARFGLFVLFTILLVGLTMLILPKLVVLGPWGYMAGFVINLLSSAAIVVPGPGFAAIMLMARELDPILLGIAAGIGGTFGELTGYWLGAQGREPLEGNRIYSIMLRTMRHAGGGLLFLFGLLPFLPIDAAGVVAGASNYPIPKFLLYVGMGKTLMSVIILYLAAKAFEWAEPYLMWLG
jgi:membrane protein YqaA with SNARE-associated domain